MPAGPRFGACLFDLDGTLIDSIPLIMESFRHTMRIHLGAVPDDAGWRAGFGTPLRPQLRKFARDDDHASRMVDTYRAYTDAHHDRLLRSYDGIEAALATLRDAGARLAVVTSKTHALARRGLKGCGLDEYFHVLIGADDVKQHKPHPAPVLAALERLSADPEDTVFIGDSPHDIEAGRAAGVQTAAALWGPFSREALASAYPIIGLPSRPASPFWLPDGRLAPPHAVLRYHVGMEPQPTINPTLPAGYQPFAYEDPFEDHVGPLGYKVVDGTIVFAFQADRRHANTSGTLHGGMLMTFADYALCLTAVWDQPGEKCVTVSCNCEFVAAGEPGALIEASGEVVRRTRSLAFVRGQIFSGERVLLTCSAIVKRIPGRRVAAAGG